MGEGDFYISTAFSKHRGFIDVEINYKDLCIRLGMLDYKNLLKLETSLRDMVNEVTWRKEAISDTSY